MTAATVHYRARLIKSLPNPYEDLLEQLVRSRYPNEASPLPPGIQVETYLRYRGFPVSMVALPDADAAFLADREGAIRVIERGRLRKQACVTLPAEAEGDSGLLGLEASPAFETDGYLYAYYSDRELRENRVVRISVTEELDCGDVEPIVTGLPLSGDRDPHHSGGQLAFQDGSLFVATGDVEEPDRAQDPTDLAGKILRFDPDGDVPRDNPSGTAVWARGFRNPFGLASTPDGRLWATENGPECSDEVDLVTEGGNYGWGIRGLHRCVRGGRDVKGPALAWNPAIGPTDATWYEGPLAALNGLLVGDFVFGFLHHVEIGADGTEVVKESVYRPRENIGITDVEAGPAGELYLVGVDHEDEDGAGIVLRLRANADADRGRPDR